MANKKKTMKKIIEKKSLRQERSLNGAPVSLYVESLFITDSSVYEKYQAIFSTFGQALVLEFMKIFYSQYVNAVSLLNS